MITNLHYLHIYPDAIDQAIEAVECAFEECNMTDRINDLHEMALQELEEVGSFSNITDSIIGAYFIVAKDMIREHYGNDCSDYFVNCYDSHFYLNGHEV